MRLTQEVCFMSECFEVLVTLICGTLVLVNDSIHYMRIGSAVAFRFVGLYSMALGYRVLCCLYANGFKFLCIINICVLHFECL